jgi:Uma2 family endonuclease
MTRLAHPSGLKPMRGQKMTYEEFLDAVFDHNHYEWVQGEAIEMSAVEDVHSRTVVYLIRLLSDFVEGKGLGEILSEPFQMHVTPDANGRQPDVMFVATAHAGRIRRKRLEGPADLVVEVVSAGTRTVDRRDKFREYRDGGVPEYWIIDPLRRQAEFFLLEDERFIPAALDESGQFHSRALPGLWIETDWLWERPPKKQILSDWGVT